MNPARFSLPDLTDPSTITWPMIAAGAAALLIAVALIVLATRAIRRAVRGVSAAVEAGRLTTRSVLIVVAIVAALGVAGIGGARSFNAVSVKFDSPLVPLVADGMIIACTALRLAALTRGWRIPGALVTTYVFIGGTVWLNIDTATGIADALAHALAPLAYAVLVEMLAHLLRLHMKLAQPAKPRLSALTWLTSPVITTRVWLHLSRTGEDDPATARALVQQVVRMASRLATLCPSYKLWPFDAARAARTACLQTIRDGLLSASELAALLPTANRLTPGELLALVDSAALGTTGRAGQPTPAVEDSRGEQPGAPVWLIAYLLGALRTSTAQQTIQPGAASPAQWLPQPGAASPVQAPAQPGAEPVSGCSDHSEVHSPAAPTDEELLVELRQIADTEHAGAALSQQQIRRALGVGSGRARRLAEMTGWVEPAPSPATDGAGDRQPQTRGQLLLVTAAGENSADTGLDDPTELDLETSSNR
ncbi:DUF2637 domain-containing protein [Kribbella sp. NBC_00382]|uniref:DUF2637 domain-containing protein n=1 Tax=Kribbella sp. NBC_00382 TaxID=2975967 RepID=UPI002E1F3EC5